MRKSKGAEHFSLFRYPTSVFESDSSDSGKNSFITYSQNSKVCRQAIYQPEILF